MAALLVRRDVPEAHAAVDPYATLVADSSRGDSAVFEALPVEVRTLLDVREAIGTASPDSMPMHACLQFDGRQPDELRRRLQLRFADSSVAVLSVVARRTSGALARVDFVRRTPGAGQRGFIWDAKRDRTASLWWFETPSGLAHREERGEIPRGSPIPRAVRALGRQLLTVPCADSSANSPTNPISGSRN